ncbi:hypothetical protein DERF_004742 [Dermatophagoides farinae]|uniref:Uncharacterized protein n=1 Tax=Dermatophagoides farinae TaxID=6954 RepID=A0A922L6H5_DERFA|nr:hypothetical protein DERF_004742 [Dermatophagoides farinae]
MVMALDPDDESNQPEMEKIDDYTMKFKKLMDFVKVEVDVNSQPIKVPKLKLSFSGNAKDWLGFAHLLKSMLSTNPMSVEEKSSATNGGDLGNVLSELERLEFGYNSSIGLVAEKITLLYARVINTKISIEVREYLFRRKILASIPLRLASLLNERSDLSVDGHLKLIRDHARLEREWKQFFAKF